MIFDQSVKLLNGFVCRSVKEETLTHELCPQCYCPEHTGTTCIWCDCVYIKEKKEMNKEQAIAILLKYVETDHADENLQAAVQVLKQEKKSEKNFFKGGTCSVVAGFTSFCVHAGGTPTSLYLLPLRMKKEIYVGTRIFFFTFVNLIKLPLYISLSMTNLESFKQSATLFPVALLGILIGYQLLKIIEEKLFYNILYALIFVTSAKLLYDYLV